MAKYLQFRIHGDSPGGVLTVTGDFDQNWGYRFIASPPAVTQFKFIGFVNDNNPNNSEVFTIRVDDVPTNFGIIIKLNNDGPATFISGGIQHIEVFYTEAPGF